LIVLRDGRNLFGVLRSYDQYGKRQLYDRRSEARRKLTSLETSRFADPLANLVLESTIERIFHTHKPIYTDAYVGLFLIRGENVVLLGEVVSLCAVLVMSAFRYWYASIWDDEQDLDMEDEVPVRPAANAEEAKDIMASIEEKKVRLYQSITFRFDLNWLSISWLCALTPPNLAIRILMSQAYKKRTEPVKTDALTKMGFSAIKEEGDNY
jgi:small nuclear ribonucleoprotein (snRNP)-like protein